MWPPPGVQAKDKVERRPFSPGAPMSTSNPSPARATLQLPTIASVVKRGGGGRGGKRERNPNSTAQQNKESRERMTRSVGNCVHRGAGPNGKSPTPRAPPPAARGEGRPRPLSEGPVSPRPARGPGAAGRRRRREGRPGVRGAGGLLGITSCRRRRISGISPTLLRPPKTNAPTHTHSHTLGPGSVSSRSFFFFFFFKPDLSVTKQDGFPKKFKKI